MDGFIKYLHNNNILLTKEELNGFINAGVHVELARGGIFLDYGELANKMAFIQTGLLEMLMIVNDTEKIIDFLCPQTCALDLLGYLLDKPSELQIRASLDSEILVFRKAILHDLFGLNDKCQQIERLMLEKSNLALVERIRWMYLPPKERYESFRRRYPDIIQEIPQYKIASFLNVTPEWLSKIRALK